MYFNKDFLSFTLKMFEMLPQDSRRFLHDLLQNKEVYAKRQCVVVTIYALHVAAQIKYSDRRMEYMPRKTVDQQWKQT